MQEEKFILTSKFQKAKRDSAGKCRNYILYFINNIPVFKQKVPFDKNIRGGYNSTNVPSNEYILGGRIHQTRINAETKESRQVSFPISEKVLKSLEIPKELKLEL